MSGNYTFDIMMSFYSVAEISCKPASTSPPWSKNPLISWGITNTSLLLQVYNADC